MDIEIGEAVQRLKKRLKDRPINSNKVSLYDSGLYIDFAPPTPSDSLHMQGENSGLFLTDLGLKRFVIEDKGISSGQKWIKIDPDLILSSDQFLAAANTPTP